MDIDNVVEQLTNWYVTDRTAPNLVADAIEAITLLKLRVKALEREIEQIHEDLAGEDI